MFRLIAKNRFQLSEHPRRVQLFGVVIRAFLPIAAEWSGG